MATKVEMKILEEQGITAIAFETNDEKGLAVIDAINMAIFGEFPKEGGYATSRRFVVHVKNLTPKTTGQGSE